MLTSRALKAGKAHEYASMPFSRLIYQNLECVLNSILLLLCPYLKVSAFSVSFFIALNKQSPSGKLVFKSLDYVSNSYQ